MTVFFHLLALYMLFSIVQPSIFFHNTRSKSIAVNMVFSFLNSASDIELQILTIIVHEIFVFFMLTVVWIFHSPFPASTLAY